MGDVEKVEGEIDWYLGAITEEDLLDNVFLGLGAAVEWIAFRGERAPAADYDKRIDEASKALLIRLQKWANDGGRTVVLGKKGDAIGKRVPIPDSVWLAEINIDIRLFDVGGRLFLSLVGDNDEWGASIEGRDDRWSDLVIDTQFVLARWKPGEPEPGLISQSTVSTSPLRKCYPDHVLYQTIRDIVEQCPPSLLPLRQLEMEQLVEDRHADVRREDVRRCYAEIVTMKRGPQGKRDPDRQAGFEKFRQKMNSAELRN